MKKLLVIGKVFIVSLIMLFTLLLLVSCKGKGLNIIISDYETQQEICTINSIDDEETFTKIFTGLTTGENCSQDITGDNVYSVLFEDPKDSTYDIWLKVVIEDDTVYAVEDTLKMDDEYKNVIGDEYYKCAGITAQEFETIIFE